MWMWELSEGFRVLGFGFWVVVDFGKHRHRLESLCHQVSSRSQVALGNGDKVPKLSLGPNFVPKCNLRTRNGA